MFNDLDLNEDKPKEYSKPNIKPPTKVVEKGVRNDIKEQYEELKRKSAA